MAGPLTLKAKRFLLGDMDPHITILLEAASISDAVTVIDTLAHSWIEPTSPMMSFVGP